MTSNDETVPLSRTLLKMDAVGYAGKSSFSKLYHAVLSGIIPSELQANGRLGIRPSNFPTVAAVLGLKPPAPSNSVQHNAEADRASV